MSDLDKMSEMGSVVCEGVGPHISRQIMIIPPGFAAAKACGSVWVEAIGHVESDKSIGFSATWKVFFTYDGTTLTIKQVVAIAPFWCVPTLTGLGFPSVALAPEVVIIDDCPHIAVGFAGVAGLSIDFDVAFDKLQAGASS